MLFLTKTSLDWVVAAGLAVWQIIKHVKRWLIMASGSIYFLLTNHNLENEAKIGHKLWLDSWMKNWSSCDHLFTGQTVLQRCSCCGRVKAATQSRTWDINHSWLKGNRWRIFCLWLTQKSNHFSFTCSAPFFSRVVADLSLRKLKHRFYLMMLNYLPHSSYQI